MSDSLSKDPRRASPRRKDAIIAAIATVLAAVILAGGTIIASGKRDRDSLREEVTTLQQQVDAKSKQIARLQGDLAAALKQASTSPHGGQPPPADNPPQTLKETPWPDAPLAQAEGEGFVLGFYGCARANGAVECRLTVTNNKEEREFHLEAADYDGDGTNSRGIDEKGQQNKAQHGTLGGGAEDTNPGITIPSGVTIRGAVTLADSSPSITEYVVLQIGFRGANRHRVDFRHVKLG